MNILHSNTDTEYQSKKKIGWKIISFSNAAIPSISILTIAAIVFYEFGAFAWGTFASEFLWLNIASKVVNYGSKEFILSTAGDNSEETGERINESINAGMIFIPAFFFVFLILPFGLTNVIWLTIWLATKYIYQSYEPFYTLYKKKHQQLVGEILSTLFIISVLLIATRNFSIIYLLQLFSIAEITKTTVAIFHFRRLIRIHFYPIFNLTYLKNNFFSFAIFFSILLKTRIDQLIATYCLPTETVAVYQIMMTLVLLSQSILYSLSYSKISKLYTLTYDYISEVSNKIILQGIIAVILLTLLVLGISYTFYAFEAGEAVVIAIFIILLSHIYSLSYVYALYKAKEEKSVIQINVIMIVITALSMPLIMHKYEMTGSFIFLAGMHIAQAILLKARVKQYL